MTFLGLKQGQDFGEPGGTPPPRIPRSTPLSLLRVFSSRSFRFIWFCYFFVTPFRPCQTISHVTSALTQFIIHASSDAPRTSKVLMNELLYMLKLLSFSITCRRWSTAFFCNTESPENRAVVARCTQLTPLTSSNEVISMVSDHSTFILVFHIVMISEGTEVRHRLNADFSCTKFIATAVAICPIA